MAGLARKHCIVIICILSFNFIFLLQVSKCEKSTKFSYTIQFIAYSNCGARCGQNKQQHSHNGARLGWSSFFWGPQEWHFSVAVLQNHVQNPASFFRLHHLARNSLFRWKQNWLVCSFFKVACLVCKNLLLKKFVDVRTWLITIKQAVKQTYFNICKGFLNFTLLYSGWNYID